MRVRRSLREGVACKRKRVSGATAATAATAVTAVTAFKLQKYAVNAHRVVSDRQISSASPNS